MFDIEENFETIIKAVYPIYLFIGAAGGLYFFIDNYRNRVRIKIRNLKEIMRLDDQWNQRKTSIWVEITNIGKHMTSLEPEIFFTGYEPEGRKIYGVFEIYDISRDLHPHMSKNIQATIKEDIEIFEFLWFKTYTFTLTRGRKKRIRFNK